jgi:hypothetical protein
MSKPYLAFSYHFETDFEFVRSFAYRPVAGSLGGTLVACDALGNARQFPLATLKCVLSASEMHGLHLLEQPIVHLVHLPQSRRLVALCLTK